MINTGVLIFNLIPAFPLDGGRVLRGIVWSVTGNYLKSTRLAAGSASPSPGCSSWAAS